MSGPAAAMPRCRSGATSASWPASASWSCWPSSLLVGAFLLGNLVTAMERRASCPTSASWARPPTSRSPSTPSPTSPRTRSGRPSWWASSTRSSSAPWASSSPRSWVSSSASRACRATGWWPSWRWPTWSCSATRRCWCSSSSSTSSSSCSCRRSARPSPCRARSTSASAASSCRARSSVSAAANGSSTWSWRSSRPVAPWLVAGRREAAGRSTLGLRWLAVGSPHRPASPGLAGTRPARP